nr:MAG TPA: hypothetical protein [Bacteriophage sp.]
MLQTQWMIMPMQQQKPGKRQKGHWHPLMI